jgi:serine/threonine protein kinase
MNLDDFRPGKMCRLKRYLAAGSWKMAFRGSAPGIPEDVALLCYHNHDPKTAAVDISRLIQLDDRHRFSSYLPEFHNLFRGDDGRLWLVEELLAQPLSSLSPLLDVGRFSRIARDLCRAVTCIHEQELVHRDIKMENCGIDQHGRAKIFDLGSLVQTPGESPCTIFTRPPEVLATSVGGPIEFPQSGDVWSLAATLYALRSGDYPFATKEDVRARARINDALARKAISREQAAAAKEPLNEEVVERALAMGAEARIFSAVRGFFAGSISEILCEMLTFDPKRRKPIADYEKAWGEIAESFASPSTAGPREAAWPRVEQVLTAFERGDLSLTPKQVEKVLQEWLAARDDQPEALRERLSDLIPRAKELAESRSESRRTVEYAAQLEG